MYPGINIVRANMGALLVTFPLASGVAAQGTAIRIDNFGQISPTYYRGAQPTGQDYADLATLGIKTVINNR